MKQLFRTIRFAIFGLALSSSSMASPTCYQNTAFIPFDVQPIQAVSCSSTPAGYGWYLVDSASYELYLAMRLDLGLNACSYMSYQGESAAQPVVLHQLIPGIECESEPFPLSTTPPLALAPVNGARLWLRADAGVISLFGRVWQWVDQSGFGNNATMSTAARRPTVADGALNGRPVLRFDGAQSLLLSTPVSPQAFTMFIVGRNSRTTETFSMILGPGGSSPNNQLRWENGSSALVVGTGNNLPVTTAVIGNTRNYHSLVVSYNGSSLRVFRDGNLITTRAMTTSGPWTLSQIGAWYSSYFLIGDLAEILVYHSALTDQDRATNDSYLRAKYGLP